MSKKQAREFLDRVDSQVDFRNELLQAKNPQQQLSITQRENLQFSKQELTQAFDEKYHAKLTQKQMQQTVAAGGKGPCSNAKVLQVIARMHSALGQ